MVMSFWLTFFGPPCIYFKTFAENVGHWQSKWQGCTAQDTMLTDKTMNGKVEADDDGQYETWVESLTTELLALQSSSSSSNSSSSHHGRQLHLQLQLALSVHRLWSPSNRSPQFILHLGLHLSSAHAECCDCNVDALVMQATFPIQRLSCAEHSLGDSTNTHATTRLLYTLVPC